MTPKGIGLKPILNSSMIFRIVENKYEEMYNRLKSCILNIDELLEDIEFISAEELSCLVVVLSIRLNEKIQKTRKNER